MVVNIPLFGIQVVANYNCITKDITIAFRLPLIDGNNGDRNNASSNGCNLICLNTDFIKNKIDKRIFDGKNYAPDTPPLPPVTPPWSLPPQTYPNPPNPPNPPNSRTFITPPYIPPKPKPPPQNSFKTQTIQPHPNPTPPPTTPKPQPVQKSDGGSDLDKAMNRIDKFIAKISNSLPPSGNNNANQNYQQQPQQITTVHRTYVTVTPPNIPEGPPPPPPRHQQPYQYTPTSLSNYDYQNQPPYSNTPVVTPPYIPPRPTTILPSSNGSYSYYTQNYSTQSNYQYGNGGYGEQLGSNTTQSNISTNQWNTVNVTNLPPPPPQSITAPATPIIQAQTISTTTTTTTKTKPVRKGGGHFLLLL
uniref:Uncharacterized protein n=1 Tax=Panagrolaimus sp. ES5 TaxID=591445 RepID=A0AC34GXK7_9BILA